MRRRFSALAVCVLMAVLAQGAPKDKGPSGILALSGGEHVVFVDPRGGVFARHETGPVGWLFPAPGGALFAPDVVNGSTTAFDLRGGIKVTRFEGVTMPHFGALRDRYAAVVGGKVMMVSYPERAPIADVVAEIGNPWQVEISVDGSVILVLDRWPDGSGDVNLLAVDLVHRRVIYRRALPEGVTRMTSLSELGLLAMTSPEAQVVQLIDPRTTAPVLVIRPAGRPMDVAGADKGKMLLGAVDTGNGEGSLFLWKLKSSKKGVKVKKEVVVPLGASPRVVAVDPSGMWAAVAMASPMVAVIDLGEGKLVHTIEIPDTPRDLAWCDPTAPGAPIARWTDGTGRPESLGDGEKE